MSWNVKTHLFKGVIRRIWCFNRGIELHPVNLSISLRKKNRKSSINLTELTCSSHDRNPRACRAQAQFYTGCLIIVLEAPCPVWGSQSGERTPMGGGCLLLEKKNDIFPFFSHRHPTTSKEGVILVYFSAGVCMSRARAQICWRWCCCFS